MPVCFNFIALYSCFILPTLKGQWDEQVHLADTSTKKIFSYYLSLFLISLSTIRKSDVHICVIMCWGGVELRWGYVRGPFSSLFHRVSCQPHHTQLWKWDKTEPPLQEALSHSPVPPETSEKHLADSTLCWMASVFCKQRGDRQVEGIKIWSLHSVDSFKKQKRSIFALTDRLF